ncbi:hypothetical protein MTO96_050658 [Rhipicephalus appendiculatus]
MAFIGTVLTIILGTVLSVFTGGANESRTNLRLTSPVFVNLWMRFKFFRELLQLDHAERNDSKKPSSHNYGDEEFTALTGEALQNEGHEILRQDGKTV